MMQRFPSRRASAATVRARRAPILEPLEHRHLMAGVSPVGPETLVNDTTAGIQETTFEGRNAIASDDNGGYVVVWSGAGTGDADGVYARLYNAAGPVGPSFRVNTITAGIQTEAAVAMDDAGRFVVVWSSNNQDGGGWGVYGQRYNPAGNAQGSEFRVNTTTSGNQNQPSIAADADGDFVVTWTSENLDGTGLGIAAQRFNVSAVPQGGEFRVNDYTDGNQLLSSVGLDAAGAFTVVWQSDYTLSDSIGIFAQRYTATGAANGSWSVVNTTTAGLQLAPSIGMNAAGAYVVAWTSDSQDGSGRGIFAQRYTAAGVRAGAEFGVNATSAGDQQYPSVAVDTAGDFVIAWESFAQDAGDWGAYARAYTAAGASIGSEFRLNSTTAGNQSDVFVAPAGGGDYVAVWHGNGAGDPAGVFLQRYEDLAPGVTVTPTSGLTTTDSGGTASFAVVLEAAPTANVTISLSSSDTTEGVVSPSSLTFTPANWNVPQTVTVTGVNDGVAEDAVVYSVVTAAAVSSDARYSGLAVADVSVVNVAGVASGGGLRGTYFDNIDFTGPRVSRLDGAINFNWASESPHPAIAPDTFSARWTGEIQPRHGETYTFRTTSDDGVRLWVNGVLLVDNWTNHTAVENTGAVTLAAGQWYGIVMEFYENTGVAVARLEWSSASQPREVVPPTRLRPANATPVAGWDDYVVIGGTSLTVDGPGVLANDTDADGDLLTASLLSGPAHGSLALDTDGSFRYTPAAGFVGPDTFTYSIDDGWGGTASATVTIDVTPPPGVAVSPTAGLVTTEAGGAATFTVVLTRMPTAPVRVDLTSSAPGEGTLSASSLVFDATNWNVPQTVIVRGVDDGVDDGDRAYGVVVAAAVSLDPLYNGLDGADVSVVNVANAALPPAGPVAGPDAYQVISGTVLRVARAGVLGNDLSPGGLTLVASLAQQSAHGVVSIGRDGSFSYRPAAGFAGTDGFVYAVTDANGTAFGDVTIVVEPSAAPDADPDGPGGDDVPVVPPPPSVPLPASPDGGNEGEDDGENTPVAPDEPPLVVVTPRVPMQPGGSANPGSLVPSPEARPSGPARPTAGVRPAANLAPAARPAQRVVAKGQSEEGPEGEGEPRGDDKGARTPTVRGMTGMVFGPVEGATSTALVTAVGPLATKLDAMARQLGAADREQSGTIRTVSQVALAMTAGYVMWSLRGASLVASLLTSLPLWRSLDPLPILEERADREKAKAAARRKKRARRDGGKGDGGEDEKLGSIVN